ncbi:phage head closure protein [Halopseudomonas sp.]|uniref:phage head closure protein n=1 Tax=Halopseudomonas sp. TaxID=2901191 RepID=UPI00311E2290
MGIKAGRLRHRVDIQQRGQLQDPDSGAMVDGWVTVWSKVPAAVDPLSVRDFIAASAHQSEIVARITLRHRAGLVATMRIVHNGQIYNPEGFLPDPDSGLNYVTAPCSLGVNEG